MCTLLKYFIIFSMANQSFGINEKYITQISNFSPIIIEQPHYDCDINNDDTETMIDHGDNYMYDHD
jgi:hypothetical protein